MNDIIDIDNNIDNIMDMDIDMDIDTDIDIEINKKIDIETDNKIDIETDMDNISIPSQPNIIDATSNMFFLDNELDSDANKMYNHLEVFLKEIEKIMFKSTQLYDILPESRTQLTIRAKNKQINRIQEFKYLPLFMYEKKNGYIMLSWVSSDILKIMWNYIMQNYYMGCPHFRLFYQKYKIVIDDMFSHMSFKVDYILFLPLFLGLFNRSFNVISIYSDICMSGMYWLVDFRILPTIYFDSYNLFSLTIR